MNKNKTFNMRIDEETYNILKQQPNTSEYIRTLIRHDNEAEIQAAYQEIKEHIEDHSVGEDFTL